MSHKGNANEQEIMEKFSREINDMNKDRLLIYMMRIQNQRNKYRKKHNRMRIKLKILKEKLLQKESEDWINQIQELNI